MEPKTEFKVGDVVRLSAGGPKMTVEFVDNVNATCVWFGGAPSVNRDQFRVTCIVHASDYESTASTLSNRRDPIVTKGGT